MIHRKSMIALLFAGLVACASTANGQAEPAKNASGKRLTQQQLEYQAAQADLQTKVQKLQHTNRLFTKGLANADQLRADEVALQHAEKRIALIENELKCEILRAEIRLMAAKGNLEKAKSVLEHSRRLERKGFVTTLQVKQDELAVQKAEKELELRKLELKMAKSHL